jgi:hypothetical protein
MSDFGGLGSIIKEAQALAEAQHGRREVDCPRCGEPLQYNREGIGNCPLGHYRTTERVL